MKPILVGFIHSDPFAGASSPRAFGVFQSLAIDGWVGEEERISTGINFLLMDFCLFAIVSVNTPEHRLRTRTCRIFGIIWHMLGSAGLTLKALANNEQTASLQ